MPDTIKLSLSPNGDLIQSDGGETNLGNVFSRNVTWKAVDDSIESFVVHGLSGRQPWRTPMSIVPAREQTATVRTFAFPQTWQYEILWTKKASSVIEAVDPKIVIQPIIAIDFFETVTVGLVIAVAVLAIKVRNLKISLRSLNKRLPGLQSKA